MKQKLGLCCALIHDPDLLVLDEPTTGVDPLARRQFWDPDLDHSARSSRSMSVMVATAYMDEAAAVRLADRDGRRKSSTPARRRSCWRKPGRRAPGRAFIRPAAGEQARRPPSSWCPAAARGATGRPRSRSRRENLTKRFGRLHRGRSRQLPDPARRDLRLPRLQRLRQDHHHADADRPAAGHRRRRARSSASRSARQRHGGPPPPRVHDPAFSLYSELSVRQNLVLYARLFRPAGKDVHPAGSGRCSGPVSTCRAWPTSSPRPAARDPPASLAGGGGDPQAADPDSGRTDFGRRPGGAGRLLGADHRAVAPRRVTIFITTHFMNEAERCDRISLMHAGKSLACDTPAALVASAVGRRWSDAFIGLPGANRGRRPGEARPDEAPC